MSVLYEIPSFDLFVRDKNYKNKKENVSVESTEMFSNKPTTCPTNVFIDLITVLKQTISKNGRNAFST